MQQKYPTLEEYYAANKSLERAYTRVYAAYPVEKGEDIRLYKEGETIGRNARAPEDGFYLHGNAPDGTNYGVFMTKQQLEQETIDMVYAGFAVPRANMPQTATLHKINAKTYSYSDGGRGGTCMSAYMLQAQFNPPAGLHWAPNVEYRTVALRNAPELKGIVAPQDLVLSQPPYAPYKAKAGTFFYARGEGHMFGPIGMTRDGGFAALYLRCPVITPPVRQLLPGPR